MGWTIMPETGPQSQIREARECGMPRSWTYGVRRESWRAQPNWMPAAMEATAAILRRGLAATWAVRDSWWRAAGLPGGGAL
ncbi:unnamed protein product [Linum tenue]|uniref:Uncharacterized protein n=1 Tax=Linum tenue TaxID=586396 RepID=A0AAV0IJD6_9ROSI|nr:unnamed protein product [Linum tenue]